MSKMIVFHADEQEEAPRYIYGIGGADVPIRYLFAASFGAGTMNRIVRGYPFIPRNHEPDGAIAIARFKRGACAARAPVGLIAPKGLRARQPAEDKERAFGSGAKSRYRLPKREFAQKLVPVRPGLSRFLVRDGSNRSYASAPAAWRQSRRLI